MAEITHTTDECIVAVSVCEREKFMTLRNASFLENQSQISLPKIQKVSPLLYGKEKLKKFFEPRVLAIGPIHHDSETLMGAEHAKGRLASSFIKTQGVREEAAFEKIKSQINYLRDCYKEEDVKKYNDEELAWMFFVDGCAVLQLICSSAPQMWEELENIKIDMLIFSQFDILMLENQLPYKVLQLLVSSTVKAEKLKEAINKFIDRSLMTKAPKEKEQRQQPPTRAEEEGAPHLLGRLLAKLRNNGRHKPAPPIPENVKEVTKFRNVSELKDAGIFISPSKTRSLKDISFKEKKCVWGHLKIPRLIVDDSTAFKFMNLAAYEMCPDFHNDFEVTRFLRFLSWLIDSAEDVKELRASGVILNELDRDKKVFKLINHMTSPLIPGIGTYYSFYVERIHHFCNKKWTVRPYSIYRQYFGSRWSIGAFLGAVIYLAFNGVNALTSSALKEFLQAHPWTLTHR